MDSIFQVVQPLYEHKQMQLINFFLLLICILSFILTISSSFNFIEIGSPGSLMSSKTFLRNGVCARHCNTELKKQVFPKLFNPYSKK